MTAHSETHPAASPTGDPLLFTPGPLTTSPEVKEAMLHDYGSRDARFIDINARVREQLVAIINGQDAYECVPLQGSGTFVVEAMLTTFVPRDGKLLILVNGAYGKRMAKICDYHGITTELQEATEDVPVDTAELDRRLAADDGMTHVAVVQCETTSGVLNPIADVAAVVARHGRHLLIDAMSAFGALPLDSRSVPFDAVVASSNKCLEGVPGMGFCLARRDRLEPTKGNCDSLCLDLFAQWENMQRTRQWRFTPPTHCIAAFAQALEEFQEEGGVAGRGRRYQDNCHILTRGMRDMGFATLLPDQLQAPIIVTFHKPADPKFDFDFFYNRLRERGYVIYPGKLTVADSFRMGCIGQLHAEHMHAAVEAVRGTLNEMNVTDCAPAGVLEKA